MPNDTLNASGHKIITGTLKVSPVGQSTQQSIKKQFKSELLSLKMNNKVNYN